jgi:hypothetical protein
MLITRRFLTSVFIAGVAAAAIVAAPTAVIANTSATGPGWNGCGGWSPAQGGFGSGCVNGMCGGWDGNRGWGNQ